jgi:hypothetical protein
MDAYMVDSCGFWAISATASGKNLDIVKLLSNHMYPGKSTQLPQLKLDTSHFDKLIYYVKTSGTQI